MAYIVQFEVLKVVTFFLEPASTQVESCFYSVLFAHQITVIGNECLFEHQNFQMFGRKLKKYEYFYPIEVVCRGSEISSG